MWLPQETVNIGLHRPTLDAEKDERRASSKTEKYKKKMVMTPNDELGAIDLEPDEGQSHTLKASACEEQAGEASAAVVLLNHAPDLSLLRAP